MRLVGVERVRDQIQNVAMLNLQHYHIKCLDLRSIEGHDFNKLNILEKQNLKIKKKKYSKLVRINRYQLFQFDWTLNLTSKLHIYGL